MSLLSGVDGVHSQPLIFVVSLNLHTRASRASLCACLGGKCYM